MCGGRCHQFSDVRVNAYMWRLGLSALGRYINAGTCTIYHHQALVLGGASRAYCRFDSVLFYKNNCAHKGLGSSTKNVLPTKATTLIVKHVHEYVQMQRGRRVNVGPDRRDKSMPSAATMNNPL